MNERVLIARFCVDIGFGMRQNGLQFAHESEAIQLILSRAESLYKSTDEMDSESALDALDQAVDSTVVEMLHLGLVTESEK